MSQYHICVTDKRPKAIVRYMLIHGIGPRDPEGRDAILTPWWSELGYSTFTYKRFREFMLGQDWTLGEMMSYLSWQVTFIMADGIDAEAFNLEWDIVKSVFAKLNLLDPEWVVKVEDHQQFQPSPARDDRHLDLENLEL